MLKLSKLKSITLASRVIYLDTESYPIDISISKTTKKDSDKIDIKEHVLSFGYAFYNEYDKNIDDYNRLDETFFNNPKEFINFLLTKTLKREYVNKPLYVFAHNMAYDFRVLKTFTDKTFKKHGFKLKLAISKNVFIFKYVKENHQIIFLSSTNYFRVSLKVLGNVFGLKKLDFKFNDEGFNETKLKTKKALKYCYRDVEILEKAVNDLLKFVYHEKGKFSYTLASTSFNIFRTNFYDGNITMHKIPLIEIIEKLSYYGGRTDCFKIGTFKNIYKLDINSMYSDSMINNYYPIKLIGSIGIEKNSKKPTKEILLNYLKNDEQHLFIAEVKIKLLKAKVPYRDNENKKLIYPIGTFTTTLCQPELEILTEDEIIDVNKILIYKKDKLFNKFVKYFYNKRLEFKDKHNDVMQYFCKILLNSLYGKFAQKQFKQVRNSNYDDLLLNGKMDYLDTIKNKFYKFMFIDGNCFEILEEKFAENTFVPISSFVTSYSRVSLYKLINLVEKYLIYVDTDSLFVTKKGYDILKKLGYIDNILLGKLKLEGVLSQLKTRTLKDYTIKEFIKYDYFIFRNEYINCDYEKLETEYKIKGIKKEAITKAIKNNEDIDNKTDWLIERFIGFNEGQRFFNLIAGTLIELKTITHKYTKGIIKENGDVEPLILNEV